MCVIFAHMAADPRVKIPETGDPRLRQHDERIKLNQGANPLFRWVVTGARTIEARSFHWNTGESVSHIPFRPIVNADVDPIVTVPTMYETDDALAFDINTSGLGGLIDGVALAAEQDYWCWAFLTRTLFGTLYGVGVTTRPRIAIPVTTGVVSGGGLGTTAVFNCTTAGHANRVAVGSRVRIEEGTTLGSNWNQGLVTVVDVSTNRITVVLDAAQGLGLNSNTTLAGAAAKTLIQLDNPEPKTIYTVAADEGTAFGGKPFVYLGSLQTDASSNIRTSRKRGDLLELLEAATIRAQATITASESIQAGLGNWLPLHAQEIHAVAFTNITAGTPGNGRTTVASDNNANLDIDNRTAIGGNIIFTPAPGTCIPLQPSCSVQIAYIETGALTVSYQVAIHKYREIEW